MKIKDFEAGQTAFLVDTDFTCRTQYRVTVVNIENVGRKYVSVNGRDVKFEEHPVSRPYLIEHTERGRSSHILFSSREAVDKYFEQEKLKSWLREAADWNKIDSYSLEQLREAKEVLEMAENCCAKCRFELTCGYSPMATIKHRTENSYLPCCLGNMSYDRGPFFKPNDVADATPTIVSEPNDPLTLAELLKMNGEPVWVTSAIGEYPMWYIVDAEEKELRNPWERLTLEDWDAGYPYKAYRRKPEEEV